MLSASEDAESVFDGLGASFLSSFFVQAVYAEARRRQCNRVYWCTQAGNTGAQALYRQLAQQTDMIQFRHNLPEY